MLTTEQNENLTRVEGNAPMGALLRSWTWFPFAISTQIVAGEAPTKVRLLGVDYVAFRTTDGQVGFIDEACPHRGVSMALARNEGCMLRCIFHGWAVNASGNVVEAPTHHGDKEAFLKGIHVRHYPVREQGGLVWVWLGDLPAAEFPDLPAHLTYPHLYRRCDSVREFRNRVFHHEPILHRDITAEYSQIMELIRWLSLEKATWIKPYARVMTVVRQKP